jgi:5-bromo-4-chloroindolyl phosphate hydrolysis protein
MGKAILVIILIAIAAFIVYKQTHHPASEEELKVKAVEERFISASNKFMSAAAGGMAAGLDETEAAMIQVQKTRAELIRLSKTLTEPKAILKAEELRAKIDEFCRKNDIK